MPNPGGGRKRLKRSIKYYDKDTSIALSDDEHASFNRLVLKANTTQQVLVERIDDRRHTNGDKLYGLPLSHAVQQLCKEEMERCLQQNGGAGSVPGSASPSTS
jgi:hypothetical protein